MINCWFGFTFAQFVVEWISSGRSNCSALQCRSGPNRLLYRPVPRPRSTGNGESSRHPRHCLRFALWQVIYKHDFELSKWRFILKSFRCIYRRGGMVQTAEQYEFLHRAIILYEKSTLSDYDGGCDWDWDWQMRGWTEMDGAAAAETQSTWLDASSRRYPTRPPPLLSLLFFCPISTTTTLFCSFYYLSVVVVISQYLPKSSSLSWSEWYLCAA